MKIVFYACVPVSAEEGKVCRARVTVDVGNLGPLEIGEHWVEAFIDYLPGGVAHDSCHHAPTFDLWSEEEETPRQLTIVGFDV